MILTAYLTKLFAGFIGSSFFGFLKKTWYWFVLIALVLMLSKCAFNIYQERSKDAEATRQSTIGTLQNTNEANIKAMEQEQKAQSIDHAIVSENLDKKQEFTSTITNLDKRKQDRIAKIEANSAKHLEKIKTTIKDPAKQKEATEKATQENEQEVSQAHIDHLWSVYCEATNKPGNTCQAT